MATAHFFYISMFWYYIKFNCVYKYFLLNFSEISAHIIGSKLSARNILIFNFPSRRKLNPCYHIRILIPANKRQPAWRRLNAVNYNALFYSHPVSASFKGFIAENWLEYFAYLFLDIKYFPVWEILQVIFVFILVVVSPTTIYKYGNTTP